MKQSVRLHRRAQSGNAFVRVDDAPRSLQVGRVMARAWADQIDDRRRQSAAWAFIAETIRAYVDAQGQVLGTSLQVSPLQLALTYQLDTSAAELAATLGRAAANLAPLQACYQISATYTALLPTSLRSEWGAYYTPPALTERLLQLAEEAGTDWTTARVLDPACGGGAFLLPVALRMRQAMPELSSAAFITHLATHLRGFEIDPFAAWLTQIWLETTFAAETAAAGCPSPAIVTVGDSLDQAPGAKDGYDLVIGNPPYGRVKLTAAQRANYARSLYGHANLYGVFTDLALRWTRPGGVVAYVTPTSFLAGEYFKALRGLLAKEAPPVAIDFVSARRGVFEDVLQEAALSTYRRGGRSRQAVVHFLDIADSDSFAVTHAGRFKLPKDATDPWLAPREPGQQRLVEQLVGMPTRLADWGYKISTGPLVWNRFKDQLRLKPGKGHLPLIWAEAVSADGKFTFKADKRNHQPYFKPTAIDDWLKVTQPCVLVQRTTAKEQARRLIAAELPQQLIAQHSAVIVENHLNMVRPLNGTPKISPAAVAAVLNSRSADQAFRCISGSVAVSAFELEALPLPSVEQMRSIERLLQVGAPGAAIENILQAIYFGADA
jgi:adenine-specific DNA-methyltransferase